MTINIDTQFLDSQLKEKLHAKYNQGFNAFTDLQELLEDQEAMVQWYNWPQNGGFELLKNIKQFHEHLDVYFDAIVVVGIGGSYLGIKALEDIFRHSYSSYLNTPSSKYKPIFYAGNDLSEIHLIELMETLQNFQPLLIVISKSGNTIESNIAFCHLYESMLKHHGQQEMRHRTVLITNENSGGLRELANDQSFKSFSVPNNIGGRFSVLTAVGLLPMTLAGYDTESILEGASHFYDEINKKDAQSQSCLINYACFRRLMWDEGKKIELLSYSMPKLHSFVEWWKQLFAESEGKNKKGLFPVGIEYSKDLHSFGQIIQEGYTSFFETFLLFKNTVAGEKSIESRLRIPKSNILGHVIKDYTGFYVDDVSLAALSSARLAHSEAGVPCVTLNMPKLNEFYIGYLLSFFKTTCAVSAILLGVNPFDQPGVEAYKIKLKEMIKDGSFLL